jgi:glycosyltransferase involved in cell wall biosynthesis
MKIALDGTLLGARFSGVERSVAQLLAHLPAAAAPDHELTVFVGEAFDEFVATYHPDGLDPTGRLRIVRTGVDNRIRAARIWFQQMVLPRLVEQCGADVFHGPAYICPVTMRRPRVVTVYDLISIDEPRFATRANHWYYRLFLLAGVRRAQRVIVPSAATRAALVARLPAVAPRVVTIPLGVEERFFDRPPDESAIRERYRLPARYLLWVGNIEPKKNVGILLEALRILRTQGADVPKLVLAGPLSWGTNDLMRRFLAHGLHDRVQFLGRAPDADLPALYRGATGFLFPSLSEGFGLPPLEAMAAGVPVAAANRASLPEVVGHAGLLVPADDAAAWAQAMVSLTGDTHELVRRGVQRARRFRWEETARASLAAYAAAQAAGENNHEQQARR